MENLHQSTEAGSGEQMELFFESDPDAKERFKKVNFRVSILGGNSSESDARTLGHALTKEWYSIASGGYNFGAMKGALEGADSAIQEIKNDSAEARFLSFFNPAATGIVAENFPGPIAAGENVSTEAVEGKYGVYVRLGKLIEDSSACIVLPGDTGTQVEVMANLHFNQKLKAMMKLPTKPVIFVGDQYDEMLKSGFGALIQSSSSQIYKAATVEEAVKLIDLLFSGNDSEDNKNSLEQSRMKIEK